MTNGSPAVTGEPPKTCSEQTEKAFDTSMARDSDQMVRETAMIGLSLRPAVLTGIVAPLGDDGRMSGIGKRPAAPPWTITTLGVQGDAQADARHHGGPEKAVHHYDFGHYPAWRAEIGERPALTAPGGFGENLSTTGWDESQVHIGDILRFGSAVLQVSQGRQPCWKLNVRFACADMALRVQSSGRTGWYYRVLEEGLATPEDDLRLIGRLQPSWPLTRIIALLYRKTGDRADLTAMAELPELAEGWRVLARRRLERNAVEDWSRRLVGD